MNFDWKEKTKVHLREDVCLMNIRNHEVFSDKIWMTFLKIPMMVKDAANCKDTFDKWLYLFKNMEKMEAMPQAFTNDPVFRRLGEVARVAALDNKSRSDYEKSLKIYRDNYAIAMTERTEGRAEGRAEGVKIMSEMGIPHDVIAAKFKMPLSDVEAILGLPR